MLDHKYIFRKANKGDEEMIWKIIQQAIERRRHDGSQQWQDGYPNLQAIRKDIDNNWGYIIENENIAAYVAIIFEPEPAYEAIEGNWLSEGDYVVVHRVAVANEFGGQGFATKIFGEVEKIALKKDIKSIKVDTSFDNAAMLRILEKLGYSYRGEVYFRGNARKAFEKLLINH